MLVSLLIKKRYVSVCELLNREIPSSTFHNFMQVIQQLEDSPQKIVQVLRRTIKSMVNQIMAW